MRHFCRFSKKIRVKLTADGTNFGKRIHCVMVAVILLDHLPTVGSVDCNGLFLIVIFLHCISVIDGFPQLGVHSIAVSMRRSHTRA